MESRISTVVLAALLFCASPLLWASQAQAQSWTQEFAASATVSLSEFSAVFGARSVDALRSEVRQDELSTLDSFVRELTNGGVDSVTNEVFNDLGLDPNAFVMAAGQGGSYGRLRALSFGVGEGGIDRLLARYDRSVDEVLMMEGDRIHRLSPNLVAVEEADRVVLYRGTGWNTATWTETEAPVDQDATRATPPRLEFPTEPNVVVLVQTQEWTHEMGFETGLWSCLAPTVAIGLNGREASVAAIGPRIPLVFPEHRALRIEGLGFAGDAAAALRMGFAAEPLLDALAECPEETDWPFGDELYHDILQAGRGSAAGSLIAAGTHEFALALDGEDTALVALSFAQIDEFIEGVNGLLGDMVRCTVDGCQSRDTSLEVWLRESVFWLRSEHAPRPVGEPATHVASAAMMAEQSTVLGFSIATDFEIVELEWIESIVGRGRIVGSLSRQGDGLHGRVEFPQPWSLSMLQGAELPYETEVPRRNIQTLWERAVSFRESTGRFPVSADASPPNIAPTCAAVPDWSESPAWEQDAWEELNFAEPDESRYFYQFDSNDNPAQFTASAFGDLDCDGVYSTFVRFGRAAPDEVLGESGIYIVNELE